MIRNYLKVALRNLWRHWGYSLLNIIGLTIGMTAFFLIFLYVHFELSYDSMHSKADRIYRIVADIKTPTETIPTSVPAWAVPPHLPGYFPEVEATCRVSGENSLLFRLGDKKFQENNTRFVDSTFFRIFDFPLIEGDRRTALNAPFSIILSQSAAKKYFGKEDPMGKTILMTGNSTPGTVTGVIKDMPENSQVKGDLLISMNTITEVWNKGLNDQWGNYGPAGYVLLKPGANASLLQSKLPGFLKKMDGDEMTKMQMTPTLYLEKLRDVYLYSTRDDSKTPKIYNVATFAFVGLFILLIACINFINLTTARSADRAKEVGIRKVVGAGKGQLARQFIGESVILCVIAFIISIGLAAILIPSFNNLSGKEISAGIFAHPSYIGLLFLVSLLIGWIAGLYPALVLSSFNPVSILKGRFATGSRGSVLRKVLVVTQFSISTGLIIATIVVYNQLSFMRSQNLGFSMEQKMIVDTHGDSTAKAVFSQEIKSIPGVISTSMSGSIPGGGNPGAYSMVQNKKGDMQIANLDLYFVDFDFIPQYDMKMVAGRAFSRDFMSDTTHAMVVNEAAMKLFGYTNPTQIIGRKFDQWGRQGTVIGVVKDFHFHSLQEEIKPLSMRIEPDPSNLVTIKVETNNLPGTISAIEHKWKELIPTRPWDYSFLDESFNRNYRSEERFGKLFLNFSILAIFISCLGLMGLASYSTLQRTKEIGIRKVIGASVSTIVILLSKDFITLVLIAFLIAAPISGYLMHNWLKPFPYRTGLYWWIFAAAGILALLIAVLTVSFQAIRAATVNPTKSLATE